MNEHPKYTLEFRPHNYIKYVIVEHTISTDREEGRDSSFHSYQYSSYQTYEEALEQLATLSGGTVVLAHSTNTIGLS